MLNIGSEQFASRNSVGPTCMRCSSGCQRRRTARPPALRRQRVAKQPKAGRSRLLTAKCQAARLNRRSGRPKLWRRMGQASVARLPLNNYEKSRNYFLLGSFFDSPFESLDSFVARLDSPGRYSSCSAAAKAFSNPTISSPGRSVSNDSTSLRSCSSE
jgi:hypothetical protein